MNELTTISLIRAPVKRCFDLARSVEVHLKGNIHFSEQAVAEAGVTTGLNSDVCINLAGCSVSCRYSQAQRREIVVSRVLSTRLLNEVIVGNNGTAPIRS